MRRSLVPALAFLVTVSASVHAADHRSLAYLTENNPWYPHTDFPKLTTPQWVGEDGVEAVVVLAIDDMRDTAKYEAYLRPILQRLKKIDGRAPVSIMTCNVPPDDQRIQAWLDEGLNIDVHTIDHPCPLLNGGDFNKAKSTYDRCVDLLNQIPNNRPVAFRMPCCDSLNTVSPRFYSEIFNKTTAKGNHLSISSSVFQLFTPADKSIPRELVLNADGSERFRRYLPKGLKRGDVTHNNFMNWIENYPYPYVINNLCWEFPCMVPSDWEAQFLQQSNNPKTVEDMKAALDITVLKQGVFCLVFHPHGWIENGQVIDLIDHAVAKHGKKVKFLNFREALDRINENLLKGQPLRRKDGGDNGVRMVDVNRDGHMDVVVGNPEIQQSRVWQPLKKSWSEAEFHAWLANPPERKGDRGDSLAEHGAQFLETPDAGGQKILAYHRSWAAVDGGEKGKLITERFENGQWVPDKPLDDLLFKLRARGNVFAGIRFEQITEHGPTVAIRNDKGWAPRVWAWNAKPGEWQRLPARLPHEVIKNLRSPRLRFVDLDRDGDSDLLLTSRKSDRDAGKDAVKIWLMDWFATGVATPLWIDERQTIPPVARVSADPAWWGFEFDNGFFFKDGALCWQNEDTSELPDLMHRIPADELLKQHQKRQALLDLKPTSIGAAKIDITPEGPVRLAGYASRSEEVDKVHDRIFARALTLGDERQSENGKLKTPDAIMRTELTVMLTVDNCGVPASVVNEVAARLKKEFGLKRERLAVSSTHTHSAPWLEDSAPLLVPSVPDDHRKRMQEYEKQLINKLVTVTRQAIASRRAGSLYWGRGTAGFARNRRGGPPNSAAGFVNDNGPVDRRVPVLAAYDVDGELIAVLAKYACHCTTVGLNEISGDWAGHAARFIEKDNPGAIALISIGCGADANPEPRGTPELAEKHGLELARQVGVVLGQWHFGVPDSRKEEPAQPEWVKVSRDPRLKPIDPRVICRMASIDLPLGPLPTKEALVEQAKLGGSQGANAQRFLKMLADGKPIPTTVPDYPVHVWTFGNELAMVFLGGEVVVDYAIRTADVFDSDRLWVTSYSNAMPCYIPSKRILQEGGYEADRSMWYYAQPTRLAPETEDLIVDTVQRLLPPEFYSERTQRDFPPPKSPEEALKTFQTKDGLRLELVAAEPLIRDPVAFDWDETGRLWVVEMGDYPNGLTEGDSNAVTGQPGGRIRVLVDQDQDGRYDQATTFLDGIPFPTGIQRWRDGVLVTAAPEIFYAEDSDGDGRADVRKVLYRGFGEGNQQHRVNGLRWGLDNWLHVGNGDSGGEIESLAALSPQLALPKFSGRGVRKVGERLNVRGRDLRIRPDFGLMDPQAGQTQFGRCRDDQGNWFGCNNSQPMWHYVLADHYLRRNPKSVFGDVRRNVFEVPGPAPVFPTSRTLARFNDFSRVNRFTSACSTVIHRDRAMGEQYLGNSFTAEPVHNLVSRRVLSPDGVSFIGRRADGEKESEFLSSSDNWFRPTMIRTGPDGGLWIADMYRFVIEHPKWIPAEWQRKLNLRAGDSLGRIYRVVATDHTEPDDKRVALRGFFSNEWKKIPAEELVVGLQALNGWRRDAAQRMLIHRNDPESVPLLKALLSNYGGPITRVHALCTLDGLNALDPETLLASLRDKDAGVRRHAVRLSEPWLRDGHDEIRKTVLGMIDDADPHVQLQLAYSLGELDRAFPVGHALGQMAVRHENDRYLMGAIASSLNSENVAFALEEVLKAEGNDVPSSSLIGKLCGLAAAFGKKMLVVQQLFRMTENVDGPFSAKRLRTLTTVLLEIKRNLGGWSVVEGTENGRRWSRIAQAAAETASSQKQPLNDRLAAVQFLGVSPVADDAVVRALHELITPRTPLLIQQQAVRSIANVASSPNGLLRGWESHSPSVRTAIVEVLLERRSWAALLADAIKQRKVAGRDLSASHRQRLLATVSPSQRKDYEELLDTGSETARQEVVESWMPVVDLDGDVARGSKQFEKRCSACHRLKGIGKQVGASLESLKDRSRLALLTAILDPNRAVEAKFLSYTASTDDGRVFSGMLKSESSTGIVLLGTDGKETLLRRDQLDELTGTRTSFMPIGLEKDLSQQDLADIIAFVRSAGQKAKVFEGNAPRVIEPADNGVLTLSATTAEIHGPSLIFEQQYRNLGWWSSTDDHAVWTIELRSGGKYEVEVDYACHNSTAGNTIRFNTGSRVLTARVPGTGTWDDYRKWKPGTIDLRGGRSQLTVTAPAKPSSALIDLRTIRLVPVPQ